MFDFTMGKDYLLNYGIKNKEWAGDTNAGLLTAVQPHAGSPAGSAQQAPRTACLASLPLALPFPLSPPGRPLLPAFHSCHTLPPSALTAGLPLPTKTDQSRAELFISCLLSLERSYQQ